MTLNAVKTLRWALRLCFVAGIACGWSPAPATAAPEPLDEESAACQECHGIEDWRIKDPVAGRTVVLSIDTAAYRRSSHGSLRCRDCHDMGFEIKPPHRGRGRRSLYACVLCHEDDPATEWLKLPKRKVELRQSVHADTDLGPLDCHSCHDPHTFRPINDSVDALVRIDHSNAICLGCHGPDPTNPSRFAGENAMPAHQLFPNFGNHIRKLKCITCHTADTASTHHDVAGSDRSVRECTDCHSPSSPLLDVAYRPERAGRDNSLRDDAYVIGSTRSRRLELISVVTFIAVVGAIAIHGLARLVHAMKEKGEE